MLRTLRALSFYELLAVLMNVMRGEEKLLNVYGVLARERHRVPAE